MTAKLVRAMVFAGPLHRTVPGSIEGVGTVWISAGPARGQL